MTHAGPTRRPGAWGDGQAAAGMQHMVIMPQLHIMGMPAAIMFIMLLQHSMNMSFDMPAIGVISHIMPVSVILHVMVHIIMGIIGMPFIIGVMPVIIGICIGIMLPIIGIIVAVAAMFLSTRFVR